MNISFLGRLGLVPLGICAWIGLTAMARGAAAPPNDNFANAIVIAGNWGTASADTTAATAEPGEPAHAGAPAAHSVWYKLIVIQEGTMTVHTYGSAIDTRLAIYSVPANTNAAVNSVLFPVAANDDMNLRQFFGPSVSRGPSIVTFPVKNGDVYYVAVDSNRGGGMIQLSWGYNFGGLFYFVKPQFQAPKSDMIGYPQDPSGRIEFAIGRLFGYAGKVLVDVVTTNYTGPNTPAVDGVDYIGGRQTLAFTNFETMQTFSVPILQAPVPPPDTNGVFGANPNVYFTVQIVGVRFDPQENTNVLEPAVILPGYDTSVGREIDPDIAAGTGDAFGPFPPMPFSATNIINFSQTHHTTRSSERGDNPGIYVASPGYAQVWFTRNGFGKADDSPTIHWAINSANVIGDLQNNSFELSPESDYATPDPPDINPPGLGPADFLMPCIPGPLPFGDGVSVEAKGSVGSVAWAAGDFLPKLVLVPLNDDTLPEFNEDFMVEILFGPSGYEPQNCLVGEIYTLNVTIGFDGNDQPAGALEGAYNNHQQPPNNIHPGANDDIFALVVQPDQSVVIGGAFTEYNAFLRNGIARVNFDGTIDDSFNPGNGADGLVTSLALQQDGKIFMGGDFRSVNGVNRYRVARLNIQGSVDATFNPGVGADGTVWSLALSTNGSIVIGGQFDNFNNYQRSRVARLDTLGNVDLTFDTSNLRLDGTVWAVAPQSDGKVVIGGDFTTVGGVRRSRVARLNADGSLDTSFDPLLGANNTVRTLLVQADGHILVGGSFTQFHTAAHHGLTRLLSSGLVDPSFAPGTGANDTVFTVFYAPTESRIYVGGQFTTFNGTHRIAVARLFIDGTVDTSFLDTAYNQYAGLITPLFNPDLYKHKAIYALGQQDFTIGTGTNAVTYADLAIGGSFDLVGGGGGSRRAFDYRYNLTLLRGGATVGPGNITFAYPNGSGLNNANKDQQFLDMTLIRTNGTLGTIAARFSPDPLPVGPGAAIYGQDYSYNPVTFGLPWYGTTWGPERSTRMLSDGKWWRNYPDPLNIFANPAFNGSFIHAEVNILNNTTASGNRAYNLNLSIPWQANSFFLGGANIPLGLALGQEINTPSAIIDNRNPPGTFSFITTNYTGSEAGGCVSIMVIRTNGFSDTVTLRYLTQDLPGTPPPGIGYARSNINYFATSGTLTFYPGITNQSFNVCLRDDGHVDPDLALLLVITNIAAGHPMNGTALGGVTNAWLTIIDSDFPQGRLNFSAASFVTNETAGNAVINVTRTGGSQGAMTVLFSTTNTPASSAVANVNYLPVTNLPLVWTNGESASKSFMVPVLHDNQITSDLTVGLKLSTPVLNGVPNNMALGLLSNAVLTILNVDHLGTLSFSSPTYVQNGSGGFAIIPVVRQGGSVGTLSVSFNASTGINASAGVDFVATNGTLTFGPGEVSKVFTVPLIDKHDSDVANRAVMLQLTNPVPAGVLSSPSTALLSIVGDGFNVPPGGGDPTFFAAFNAAVNAVGLQPNGAIVAGGAFTVANSVTRNRLARINSDGSLDYGFASLPGQANDTIRAVALQTDGRILVGGDFTTYDGSSRNRFARVNLDGSLDWQFDPGSGLDHSAYAVVETFTDTNQTVRKILVGGSFTLANGVPRQYLAQFNNDGSVDIGFNAANDANGLDGPVWAIAVQGDHKIIIGGDFLSINGATRNHIARLNADGSLDYSFNNPGTGASDSVRALTIQLDGRILVGGLFTNFNGTVQNHIVRLNADGSLDSTFNGGLGGDGAVYTIALQPDNRILLGGEFTRWDGVTRNHLTRLDPDGSIDPTINFGAGCDSFVASLVLQTNDTILLGGGFTTYDDAPAPYLTRIFGRSVAGPGTFEFSSATFGAYETASNAVVTIRRRGGTSAPAIGTNVYVTVATSDGYPPNGATNGINYLGGLFTNTFPPGETFGTVLIPVMRDFQVTPDLTVNLQLTDIEPLGLDGLGNQPIATLFISNVDSTVSFSSPAYSIAKNDQAGRATIPIYRLGSTIGAAQVDFLTTGGTAQPFGRYMPVATNVVFLPGQTVQNVFIPIIDDGLVLGDQTVTMALANATNTILSTPATATLTIIETSTAHGTLAFSAPSYVAYENGTNAYLNVVRAKGVTGTVTVDYFTRDGTALAGIKYAATNGTLVFAEGETTKTIVVPILEDPNITVNTVFSVVLTNATGGAILTGPTTVPVTILDDKVGLSFSTPIYAVSETAGTVSLSVFRQNGTNLTTTVQYSTANLTASAGINYVAITNATLTFNPGETTKNFSVQVLHDPRITGDLQFAVNLFNPSAPARLFNYPSAVVNVLDTDTGFSFGTNNRLVITNADLSTVTNASYSVLKSGTNLLVTILRTNGNTGTVSVSYATATNANDTAIAGLDYGAVSGLLTFSNLVSSQSFTVPIYNIRQIEGNRTFSIVLFNPTGGAQLVPPSTATVTIIDDISGISFSSSDYRVNENGGAATITVLRSNFTNSIVSVDYATANTPQAGINYSNVSGTLTFNPGETVKTFSVPVIDDGVLNGDVSVPLSLGNLVGNAIFVNPSAATLTIVETDGSLIIPAGSALTSESGPVNGVINPGETVTLLFALRDSTGTNTINLVATLLATNGVTKPSAPQNYGALVVHGPAVSRPFSFTASGVDGQTISATFQLQDGAINRGLAVFSFTLGQSVANFANTSAILINDSPSSGVAGLATPYPSVININGLAGLVSKATVTLTNLNHTWPGDIDALLVSPTGQKSFLMAKCGDGYAVNNVTLTFDDAAASSLPHFSQIVSGTDRPTSYAVATPPFPPGLTPPQPYSTNLSVFNGNNPNGAWSLYVIDDTPGNYGAISGGWSLSLAFAGVIMPTADVGLAMTAAPSTVVATSNLVYTLTLTNYGPSTATNIVVTNALPTGMVYVSSSPSLGNVSTNAGVVSWTLNSLAKDATASLALLVRANRTGVITNTAGVTAATSDLNPDDDKASAVVTVVSPTADLALDLADAPDPVLVGSNLTYTITVQNLGPATATGVVAYDILPPTVNFISASPANSFTVAGQVVTFTNLGNLANGAQTTLTIVVQPFVAGTVSDSASSYSGIVDPLKANNSAAVKTIVQSGIVPTVTLSISLAGSDVIIAWPVNSGTFILESAPNLNAPVVWSAATIPPPVVVGGQNTVTVPISGSGQFFRLHGTP
jgi:uncharacterized delta-60 repeat protein/uncharacterized repeat protein (TIGR01451 family)